GQIRRLAYPLRRLTCAGPPRRPRTDRLPRRLPAAPLPRSVPLSFPRRVPFPGRVRHGPEAVQRAQLVRGRRAGDAEPEETSVVLRDGGPPAVGVQPGAAHPGLPCQRLVAHSGALFERTKERREPRGFPARRHWRTPLAT